MWRLLNKKSDCDLFCEHLEAAAGEPHFSGTLEEFLAGAPPAFRAHLADCENCRRAAEDFFAARALLLHAGSSPVVPGAWFTARVMASIDARETELARAAGTWTAVPKYASRLAFATVAAILVASTMFLGKPNPRSTVTADSAQESLFENSLPPMTNDEILLSLAERTR